MKRALLPGLLLITLLLTACAPTASPGAESTAPASEVRALTGEETDWFNQYVAAWEESEEGITARPVGGIFGAPFADVRELAFQSLVGAFPSDQVLTDADQAEYDALTALSDSPWDRTEFPTPSRLPIPVRRIRRAAVDQVLEQYAGITTAELKDTSGVPYLEQYDAWYVDGDFGGDYFKAVGGEMRGDSVLLWSAPAGKDGGRMELALQKSAESWHIRSYRNSGPNPDHTLLALLRELRGEEVDRIFWPEEGGTAPTGEALAALLRTAAARPVEHGPLTVDGSDTDVVWSLEVSVRPDGGHVYAGPGTLQLWVGREEELVQIFAGPDLPEDTVWVKDQALYRLVQAGREG